MPIALAESAPVATSPNPSPTTNRLETSDWLIDLGWDLQWADSFQKLSKPNCQPARIVSEGRGLYQVVTAQGQLSAQLPGRFSHRAESAADLPKVGDWVALATFSQGPNPLHLVETILERRSVLARKVTGKETEEQILVTNVTVALIVHGLDRGVNLRLLERQLVMVRNGQVQPVIVLNKAELSPDPVSTIEEVKAVVGEAPVLLTSAKKRKGLRDIKKFLPKGSTGVFLGSSGVGKSSLVNALMGEEFQLTIQVRPTDLKGRHTTSAREMFPLPEGGMIIDTPGMRELQLWTSELDVQTAFEDIESLSLSCHFSDCTHTKENRCAVLDAAQKGELQPKRLEHYRKLKAEALNLKQKATIRGYVSRKRQTRVAMRQHADATKNPKHWDTP